MSMQSALEALNKATTTVPETPKETPAPTPTNMANTGANTNQDATTQPTQETKENETTGLQTSEVTEGGVEAAAETQTSPETPKTEEAPKAPVSQQFAALAKKEKAIVKQQAEIKAKETAFAQREAEIAAREAKVKESESLFETDPFEALKLRGYSYEKLTDMILSGQMKVEKAPEDPTALAKRLANEIREEISAKEKAREDAAKKSIEDQKAAEAAQLEEAYAAYRSEVKDYTTQNADDYELINLYGQQEAIVTEVQAYYEEHKRVLSVKEASDIVEKKLEAEVQKALGAKKFASKITPPTATKTEAKAVAEKATATKTPAPTKTLSNNIHTTMASTLPASTDSERMKRALSALNSQSR